MNIVQNFKISNSLKALAAMVALGAIMLLTGVENGVVITLISSVVVCGGAKALDAFSTKQEAIAQEANITSLADYRASMTDMEVAA